MGGRETSLSELVRELDTLFSIRHWDADPGMGRLVSQVYQAIGFDHTEVFEVDFCGRYNGLMLRSGDVVKEIYCAVFPSQEALEELLATTRGDALLFVHHPVDMEVSGVGFLPISPDTLDRLRAQRVSVYACHAPMDCHDEIGTNASIVQAFDVQVEQSFAEYGNGYAGRIGTITPAGLAEVVSRGKTIFGVDRVEIGGASPPRVTQVAIVAGGGDDTDVLEEAERMGAQVFITGEWYTRTTPWDEQGREWAIGNRAACEAYAESSKMALLGFSHAATEYLVMRTQMADYFGARDLEVFCLEQSDWWR